jgi:hypothetical protein
MEMLHSPGARYSAAVSVAKLLHLCFLPPPSSACFVGGFSGPFISPITLRLECESQRGVHNST